MAEERIGVVGAALSTYVAQPSAVVAKSVFRFSRRKPLGAIGASILLILILIAIVSGFVQPQDPYKTHLMERYAGPGSTVAGETFYLGSDQLGRDVLTRLMHGARISLYVAFVSVGIGATAGGPPGNSQRLCWWDHRPPIPAPCRFFHGLSRPYLCSGDYGRLGRLVE